MQHRALEAEVAHRPLEFGAGGVRRRQRQGGEAGEPVRPPGHGLGDQVVGAARHLDGPLGREVLRAAREVRKHLKIDTGLVHGGDPPLAQVHQPLTQGLERHAAEQFRMREVLLEHHDLGRHHES